MSDGKTKKKPNWIIRILIGFTLIFALLFGLLLGLRWWLTTDGGAEFLESQIESRQLGPIKRVEIDGLSGDPLNKMSLQGLRVYDRDGLWLTASDIEFDWSPWPLRKRHLIVEDLYVSKIDVLRKPALEEVEPGDPFTAQIDDADIEALILDPAVMGQGATLNIDAQGRLLTDGSIKAVLNAVRTDAAGDKVTLDFNRAANGDMSGIFDLSGQAGGTVSSLLNAPVGKTVSGRGEINGTIETGLGNTIIAFGSDPAIEAEVAWTPKTATIQGQVVTTDWALFDTSRRAVGDRVNVSAELYRSAAPQTFTASAKSLNLDASISAVLTEAGGLPETLDFDVRSNRLGDMFPLPEGYTLGAGSAKGRLALGEVISGQADINIANVVSPYGRAGRLSGPVSFMPTGNTALLDTTLRAVSPVTSAELPFTLGPEAVLKATASINMDTQVMADLDVALTSGGNTISAIGTAALDASQLNLSGEVQASLKPIGSIPAGAVSTRYTAAKIVTSDLAVTAEGTFRPTDSFGPPLNGLVGERIKFDVEMVPITGGVRLRDSLISTGGVRVAAMGRVTETLDISAEVAVSKPVAIASLDITAPSQFSATVTGPRADPALRLDGTLEAATLAGQSFENIRIRTELAELFSALKGPVRLTADTTYGPLDLEARLASTQAGYAVSDLDLTVAGLSTSGDLALDANNIATGRLSLNLPQDGDRFARAGLDLENVAGEQGITLNAAAKDVVYQGYAIETLSLSAAGTLASLTGEISVEGRQIDNMLTREFGLDTPLTLTRTPESIYRLIIQPDADFGRYQLGHSEAVTLEYEAGRIGIDAPLTLSGKPLALNYTRENMVETLRVRARDLPMDLVPLPGLLGETKGQISVNLNTRHGGAGLLSGQGVIKVTDWRGFDFDKGDGFTTALTLDLQPSSVAWRLRSEDATDLNIEGEGNSPLSSGDSLISIRPNMTGSMQGRLLVQGSAKPLLTLLAAEDAEPDGQLDARLNIGGTLGNPLIEGQTAGKGIRLEIPQLGTRLRDGRFTANFTNDTIDVRDVYVRDNSSGVLEGGGLFKLGEFARPIGRLDVKAKSFQALDRKDYEGRVSGTLFFESDEETATLGGDVIVNRAEVKQFVQGRTAVVEIDVEEINGQMGEISEQVRPAAAPIKLDLRIRAPRRIFVRTRGLDVELELDVRVRGTTANPLLFGEANVRRGGYRIAGKDLQFTEGGIEFNGSLADAKVNLLAETDTQNISATVTITGTVEDPKIELGSTPERPQDEILSALLFGRSVTELSTIEAAQLAGALAQFSGAGGGFDLMGGLRDALGVGQLSIGVGEDGQASVSGGRYLAKDVYLQLFAGAGPQSTGAIIDWEIRKNLFLRSRVQSDNEQSLSLKYKKDF